MDGLPGSGFDAFEADISEDLRGRVKSELHPGERLLWAARALPTGDRRRSSPAASLIAGFLILISAGSTVMAARQPFGAQGAFVFFALVTGLIGILITLGVIAQWNDRRRERARLASYLYALTDRRAIIWAPDSTTRGVAVYTFPKGKVGSIHRVEFPDGSGDVLFTLLESGDGYGYGYSGATGFVGVDDVRRVEEQVRRTLTDYAARPEGPGNG
jgi:hypothetical protein